MKTKNSTNLKTVFKQTILSTFSQISTWVCFLIIGAIMMLTVIVLPFALPEKVGISFFPEIFYPISLMVVLWTITATTNGLELHEMTFVLSRPVSRTTYIVGKILASLVTSSLMYFVALILMLINILYFKIKVNYDVITGNNLKWIIVFLPTFLAWIFGIASAIFFRTFIKKDALISVIVYVICLLTYELYIIISVAITNQLNTTNAYLLIPSIVFSCLAVIFFIGGYVIFQRAYVKV